VAFIVRGACIVWLVSVAMQVLSDGFF